MLRERWHSLTNNFLTSDFFCLSAGIGVFVYVLLRAIFVPPYGDEIGTFFWYVQTGSFQPFYAHIEANNHIINSLFCRLFFLAFGDSIFVLRLPNVLCFLVYAYYLWQIKKLFHSKFVGACWFMVMLSSLYLISFFSLARGYGMSMAFLMGAFFYLLRYEQSTGRKFLLAGLFMTSLALWANLALMVVAIILGGIFLLLFIGKSIIKKSGKQVLVDATFIAAIFLVPLFYAIEYSIALKNAGRLYHGSGAGFISSVILNLTAGFMETYEHSRELLESLIALFILATMYALIKRKYSSGFFIFLFLLLTTAAGTIALHLMLRVNYPQGRTAIQFFVLFITALFFSLDTIRVKAAHIFSSLLVLLFVYKFFVSLNLSYAPVWRSETVPYSFHEYVMKWKKQTGISPTISAQGLLGRVMNFYNYQDGAMISSTDETLNSASDFVIVNDWNIIDFTRDYDTVLCYQTLNVALLQRKEFIRWDSVLTVSVAGKKNNDEYFGFLTIPAAEFSGFPLLLDFTFKSQSNTFPFTGWIVTELVDSTVNRSLYYNIDLQTVDPDIRKQTSFHCRQHIEKVPAGIKDIKAYLYNFKRRLIDFSNAKVILYKGRTSQKPIQ